MISIQNTGLPPQPKEAKMLRNAQKAIEEHHKINLAFAQTVLSDGANENTPLLDRELTFTHQFADDQGPRSDMQDAHFYTETDQVLLAGVFDGHGGSEVADYACEQFEQRFSEFLTAYEGDVHKTFKKLIKTIHGEVAERKEWNRIGTTAVITLIDKKTKKIYTATLGDSEANIYRMVEDQKMSSIPLSCVRDWGSEKDAKRFEEALELESGTVAAFIGNNQKQRKFIRSGGIKSPEGVNVSRAIGDAEHGARNGKPLIIQKPKITVSTLKKGDIVVLACDGLKDFVAEDKIVSVISKRAGHAQQAAQRLKELDQRAQNSSNIWESFCILVSRIIYFISQHFQKNIAQMLVSEAVNAMIPGVTGGDNVTVITIEVA